MKKHLGQPFLTIVRPVRCSAKSSLPDPYRARSGCPGAKRVVTFVRGDPGKKIELPIELDGARILCVQGTEVFSA